MNDSWHGWVPGTILHTVLAVQILHSHNLRQQLPIRGMTVDATESSALTAGPHPPEALASQSRCRQAPPNQAIGTRPGMGDGARCTRTAGTWRPQRRRLAALAAHTTHTAPSARPSAGGI